MQLNSRFRLLRSHEFPEPARLVRELLALDAAVFGALPTEHLGTVDYWLRLHARCPDTVVAAVDEHGAMAGYFEFVPITAAYRQEVLAGRARDGELPLDALDPYAGRFGPRHLYLVSMVTAPAYRRQGLGPRLYAAEREFQAGLARQGRPPVSLVSVAWSSCGLRFLQRMGLRPVGLDDGGHPVLACDLPGGLPELAPVAGVAAA